MEKQRLSEKQQIYDILNKLEVQYDAKDHEASPNMELVLKNVKLEKSPFIKNLLYINSKKKDFYLVCAIHDVRIEKAFWKQLGLGAGNMRLATPEQVKDVLNVEVGSVSPFALVNDHEQKVKTLVFDQNLEKQEYLAFHPLVNDAIVELKKTEFQKFLDYIKIDPKYFDLTVTDTEAQTTTAPQQAQKQIPKKQDDDDGLTKLRIEYKKSENFSKWYQQVIIKSELIDYYDISGCYILRPSAYNIWETIQKSFDSWIKELGVENAYFPMFVSQKALETEKDHVEGFAPEVAWVTKSGSSDLKEPIAIRPTSETIMYPAFSKWVTSHRDLPILLNQWTNVVRWEFKHPTPFIRTREFLWQEGHTAHATLKEAEEMVYNILDLYEKVYNDILAVPVIKGKKTDTEKFAGGYYTTTIETIIPANSRGVQAATSHNLGQNFSKMFDITFENEKKEKELAWQTSWGLTTRSIGVMIMYHGDDKGLVLPPKVARIQVVIIPIYFKDTKSTELLDYSNELFKELKQAGVRVYLDDTTIHSPGWKFNNWELKGVPIRIEVGPKEVEQKQVRIAQRFNGEKQNVPRENIGQWAVKTLDEIQNKMYQNASQQLQNKVKQANDWQTFMEHLNAGNGVITPWCGDDAEEGKVKERSAIESKNLNEEAELQLTGAAKTLCIPFNQEPIKEGEKCFFTGRPAQYRVLWGRSY